MNNFIVKSTIDKEITLNIPGSDKFYKWAPGDIINIDKDDFITLVENEIINNFFKAGWLECDKYKIDKIDLKSISM